MILDDFKLVSTIIQIEYAEAYLIWDNAGAISKKMCDIWPNLKSSDVQPNQQALSGNGVSIQTGLTKSTLTIAGSHSFDKLNTKRIKGTLDLWFDELELTELIRISMRVLYVKEFDSMLEANQLILGWNLVSWPTTKVFDQPEQSDLNGIDVAYRFEDSNSFSVLRLRAGKLKYEVDLDPALVENAEVRVTKKRTIIDFDRGLLGAVDVDKFRIEEWLKGYQHILRRDIEKVIKV